MKQYRQLESQVRRARDRHLMAHERYDDLQTSYPNSIAWDYF